MTLETLLLFVPACFALNMAFGPNNLLSMTLGARYGLRVAILAAVGRLLAFTIMIAVAALGVGALLSASEAAFMIVKLLGAAYLVWLGLKILLGADDLPSERHEFAEVEVKCLIRQEFLVAIGNPKAILIFTAFFPQFVLKETYWGSFLVLGTIFIALELVAICLYACSGTCLSTAIRDARGLRWINRISGSTMIAFGAFLAMARRPAA